MTVRVVVDALVADQPAGIGVVSRGFLAGAAGREDVLALVPPGVDAPCPHVPVGVAASRAGRLALQRSGAVVGVARRHAGRGARFVSLDAFSLPAMVPPGSRVVVHDVVPFAHPEHWGRINGWHKRASCRAAFRSDARLVVSSAYNARAVQSLAGRAPAVVDFGCGQLADDEADRLLATGPATDREATILAIGTLQPRKRLDVLIEAFARARTAATDGAELVLVGDGDPAHVAHLRRVAARTGAPVRWAGRLSWSDTLPLLRRATALVFAATDEGFGLPVLEALAAGTRPVVHDLPVVRSWAGDWPTYVDPTDPDGLVTTLRSVLANDLAFDAIGAMRAVAHHRWRRFADQLLADDPRPQASERTTSA